MVDERALAYVRELEREDERLASALDELGTLAAKVGELRARAAEIAELLERLPDARRAAQRAVAEAERELDQRRDAAARAETALAEAERKPGDRETLAAARREATKARDDAASSERRRERARELAERLEREAREGQADVPRLERRARALAERMAAFPQLSRTELGKPPPGLEGGVAWSARAHGALFVARNNLETERERVVRQANELLATVTGEPAATASVARARERLESLR